MGLEDDRVRMPAGREARSANRGDTTERLEAEILWRGAGDCLSVVMPTPVCAMPRLALFPKVILLSA